MTNLADLAPIVSSVKVRGKEMDVHPLRLSDIALLIAKNKSLVSILDNGDIAAGIMQAGPDAVSQTIAAALRTDLRTVVNAGLTGVEEGRIVVETIELTLPEDEDELSDFVQALVGLINRAGAIKDGRGSSNS